MIVRQSSDGGGVPRAELQKLDKKVYSVPDELDQEVATLKLAAMHIGIDTLTPEQVKFMASWSEGT